MSKDIQTMKKTSSMLDLVHRSKGTMVAPREVLQKIEVLAPEAVETLEYLMKNSKADSVRLKAAVEVLELAGISKETRISIRTDVKDLDEKEIDQRLASLLGTAAGILIDSTAIDITPRAEDGESTPQD